MTLATAQWDALGTTALVRVDGAEHLPHARTLLASELARLDRAASRFRPDSELTWVNRNGGGPISPLLHELLTAALAAAKLTSGAVDPTLGAELIAAGYARDFATLDPAPRFRRAALPRVAAVASRSERWPQVRLTDDPPSVALPAGVMLDLGATAKALAADRAADRIARDTGTGTLVSLGGDIAVAGSPPAGGWAVRVTDDHRDDDDAEGQTVAIDTGGLATSSTTVRRWLHRGAVAHHIIDPDTGLPAVSPWRTVSVTAATCTGANAAATAAIVLGERAVDWLAVHGLAARLVADDGTVHLVGGWPAG